ncbi:MAG TPA: GNAT family N-acetyltransferase [Caulobacteraceae bacterium]
MDGASILARYDAEVRADPPAVAGVTRAWTDGVLRTTGAYNFITWWQFPSAAAAAIVAREAAFFRGLGGEVEWKVYSHDRPPGLETLLSEAGFIADEAETFLVFDLEESSLEADPPSGIDIRQVTDAAGLADHVSAASSAFAEYWSRADIAASLEDPALRLYVAYADGTPIGASRLEAQPGCAFAGLWGGGVAPAWRGRGVYRAMVAARAKLAARSGHRFLTVDARETSRPILERLGFTPLGTIRGWILNKHHSGDGRQGRETG